MVSFGAALGGNPLERNPLGIVAIFHRQVGRSSKFVGFAGGLDTKGCLIELEKNRAIG